MTPSLNWALIKSPASPLVWFEREAAEVVISVLVCGFFFPPPSAEVVLLGVRRTVYHFSILSYLKHLVQGPESRW